MMRKYMQLTLIQTIIITLTILINITQYLNI